MTLNYDISTVKINIPSDLLNRAEQKADFLGVSLNQLIIIFLTQLTADDNVLSLKP